VRRLLGGAGAALVFGLSMAVIAPAPGAFADVPIPIPVLPAGEVGVVTTEVLGGATTVEPVAVVLTGLGAYQGTCWLLGILAQGSGSCPNFTLFGIHFGTKGDDRSSTFASGTAIRSGNNPTFNGPDGHYGTNFFKFVDQMHTGSMNGAVRYGYTCADGTSHETGYNSQLSHDHSNDSAFQMVVTDMTIQSAVPGQASVCGSGATTYATSGVNAGLNYPDLLSSFWIDLGTCAGFTGGACTFGTAENTVSFTRLQTWTFSGAKTWTVKYSETCENAAGATSVQSQTISYLPTPNSDTPAPTLPKCWDVLPGGHVRDYSVGGGRSTVENPEVNVHYPTFSGEAASSYPLCTTKAPPGGCFLDLQRNGKSCLGSGVYCAGWLQNKIRWNMSCEWGPYELDVEACEEQYGTRFDTEAPPAPDPTPTVSPPRTEPCYVDCVEPEIPVDPENPKDGGTNCISGAFSWNPINWVYVPVKCALKWAFVPTDLPSFGDIPSPLPGGWIPSFPSLGSGACGPIVLPSISLGPLLESSGSHTLVNTCNGPWPAARNATYYGVLAVGLISAGNRSFRVVMAALGMAVDQVASSQEEV
jgi:hypothetical protein